jgi:outer membrane scaffolding protein for murein synthesis (MipA/OmpV family)
VRTTKMKMVIVLVLTIFATQIKAAPLCAPESPSLINFACENNKGWIFGFGFEAEHGHAADGSKKLETEIEPGIIFQASSALMQVFLEGQENGIRFFPKKNFNFSLVARLESGRDEEDDPILLQGQGNSKDKWMFRPELRLDLTDNWNFWLGATALLGDSEIGNLYIAVLGLGINKIGPFDLELLISQRWASSAFINKDFGVNQEQNARNGLNIYSAESGTQSSAVALVGRIDWSNKFKTLFEIGYDKYSKRFNDSPIIKRGQDYEYEIGTTLLYLF